MGTRDSRLTRREALAGAGAMAGWLAAGGDVLAAAGEPRASIARQQLDHYRSRPDLRPPMLKSKLKGQLASGYLFIGPSRDGNDQTGSLIADDFGNPVWWQPNPSGNWVTNFAVRSFLGHDVLAWWEGPVIAPGFGLGAGMIWDSSYRQLYRVQAANGRKIDLHELQLTPEGTALFLCYPQVVHADLSSIGGPSNGSVYESVIQEVDVRSGRLLMEWRSLDHISIGESYEHMSEPYDYAHINSIEVLPDSNLLISGRHTWATYKIDRSSGQVIWRLGGKRSDFAMHAHSQFSWQHDARVLADGSITVFDNGSDGYTRTEPHSRALVLDANHRQRAVRLKREYQPPYLVVAAAMGNVQVLKDGHVLVNWGDDPLISEYSENGRLLANVHLPQYRPSYRSYRFHWRGSPQHPPLVAATRNRRTHAKTLYASWNGATRLAHWQVLLGSSPRDLRPAKVVARRGFETAIPVGTAGSYAAVRALDHEGRKLGSSRTIRL